MRKFYVQFLKGKTSIIEVEGEMMSCMQDIPLFWNLKERDEYAFNIAKPASLTGERFMSFAFSDTLEEAIASAHKSIEVSLNVQLTKSIAQQAAAKPDAEPRIYMKAEDLPALLEKAKSEIEIMKLK